MRGKWPRKEGGDKLSAGLINKIIEVCERVDQMWHGSYTQQHGNVASSGPPWVQRIVKVTSDTDNNGGSVATGQFMYYDIDTDTWVVNEEDNEIDIDPRAFTGLTLKAGDIINGWWDAQRGAFIPISSSTTAPPRPPTPSTPPQDTSCCGVCPEGVDLPGGDVCCKGHLLLKFTGWPNISQHELKFMGGHEWGTDPFVGPLCATGSGTSNRNKYRWKLTASRNFNESTLILETVENNGCPLICIVFKSILPFRCQCANTFYLEDWNGATKADIGPGACELCVFPVPQGVYFPPVPSACLTNGVSSVLVPSSFSVTIAGADGWALKPAACQSGNGADAAYVLKNTVTTLDCSFNGNAPPPYADINVNQTFIHDPADTYLLGGVPNGGAFTNLFGADFSPCAIYGVGIGSNAGAIRYLVGNYCSNLSPVESRIQIFTYLLAAPNYGGDPNVYGIKFGVRIMVPTVPFNVGAGVPVAALWYESPVQTINFATVTQGEIDALFDANITLTFLAATGCFDSGIPAGITQPSIVTIKSLSDATLVNAPSTSSGYCGTPCEPPDSGIGTTDDTDPGGCCINGEFYRELTQSECDAANGTWYSDAAAGEAACEGAGACCIDTANPHCIMTTSDQCAALAGVFRGVGTSCGGSTPCEDTSSQSASSLSSQSASSQSHSSASSISSQTSQSSVSSQSPSSGSSGSSVSSESTSGQIVACCIQISAPCVVNADCHCVDGMLGDVCLAAGGDPAIATCATVGLPCNCGGSGCRFPG